ncbi:MAG: class I SAM-dependent methyltransferase [Holosporales bacterium]|jgi:SAM-dependent methyltransferase|nr:class I SAM-dependent methyltransferase [Holosporales bacterium]
MDEYLKGNFDYWQKGYYAPNVESYVFRMWGQVLQYDFSDKQSSKLKMLDFGCGQGAALSFFNQLGFDAYGVDISEYDLDICKKRMGCSEHFKVVNPVPNKDDDWFDVRGGGWSLVTAFQVLYYYSDDDLQERLLSLYNQMKPGAILCATMMGTKNYFYKHSRPYKNGMRCVTLKNERLSIDNYYVNFIENEDELIKKFSMFKKMHIGYYDSCFREDEGSHFHWTYIGRK